MREYMVIAFLAALLAQVDSSQVLSTDEFANNLEAANVLLNHDFDTTFEYRVLKAGPAEQESPWDPQDWLTLETFRYVALDDKLHTERLSYERTTVLGADPTVRYRQEDVWADGAWAVRVQGQNAVTLYAQSRPTDPQSKGFIYNLIEGRYPSSHPTLAELIRAGQCLQQSVEDRVLTYRFARDSAQASRVQYSIRARLEPTFALLGYTVELSNSTTVEEFQDHVHFRQVYSVLEWQQVGDLRIPRVAQIDHFGSVKPLQGKALRLSGRAFYTRQSFQEILDNEIDPELFTVPLSIGTSVYDDRIKLSFEIGNTFLSLDGTLYQLDEPVMEHPGDRLAEMIRNATPQHPPSGASSLSTSVPGSATVLEPTRSGLLRSPIVLAGLVGVGVGLLTLAVIRARRARRKAA